MAEDSAMPRREMLASDTIEGRLPTTPAWIPNRSHNVGQPDLGENLVIGCDRLLKHAEERTLRRCKQRWNSLVRASNRLRGLRTAKQPNQQRCTRDKHQNNDCNNQWRGYVHDVRSEPASSAPVSPMFVNVTLGNKPQTKHQHHRSEWKPNCLLRWRSMGLPLLLKHAINRLLNCGVNLLLGLL